MWKVTRNKIVLIFVLKQMLASGEVKSIEELKKEPEWYSNHTITKKQEKKLKSWVLRHFRRLYSSHSSKYVEQLYGMLVLHYGLRIEQKEKKISTRVRIKNYYLYLKYRLKI